MDDLISVIVPVYRVEAYLNQCLSSIANQTYRDLEIILIDDGSSDSSATICDSWVQKDNRIIVVHKENEGAGKARNNGFSLLTGEYVSLVDSDDYLENHMLEKLLSLMSDEVDLTECNFIRTIVNNSFDNPILPGEKLTICNAQEALSEHIEDRMFCQTPWGKLYRKTVLEGIDFPVGKLIDDEFWTYKVIGRCRELIHSDRRMYAYRQNKESIMHISYSTKRLQALEAKSERIEYLKEKYSELTFQAEINFFKTCIYHGQMSLRYLTGSEKRKALVECRKMYEKYKIRKEELSNLQIRSVIWLRLANLSFPLTCYIRNFLGIGT